METTDYLTLNRKSLMPDNAQDNNLFYDNLYPRNMDVLHRAQQAWENIADFRNNRIRNRNYTFGKQWGDAVKLPDGRIISEDNYLREQGKVPLKNNMIRQLVKNVLGQFRSAQSEPVCVARERKEQPLGELMSTVMQYVYQHNRIHELDSRTLEEFLISGSCFHKVGYGSRRGKTDVWIDAISPSHIFFNSMSDTRLWDCNLIGQLHDMTFIDVITRFSAGSEAKAQRLKEIYSQDVLDASFVHEDILSSRPVDAIDFYTPIDSHRCRVIEVWTLECAERLRCHDTMSGELYKVDVSERAAIERENTRRIREAAHQGIAKEEVALIDAEWFIDRFWYYRFLSPLGDVLDEGETPYWHGEHPYAMRLYPLFDGEIHSFVEDVIDQQRYINRLITMIDFIMGSSAKGVLLFPEDQIPDGMTIEDIASEWTRYNGVILFRPKPGCPMPQQVSVNATNVGAYELLTLQMRLLEDISGVHSALQGKSVASGTPASLYAQQVQYSAINLLDIFESYKTFREERDTKVMKTIQQFYDEERYTLIAGEGRGENNAASPMQVRNTEFDLSIAESAAAPAYRHTSNNFLLSLFQSGHISLQALLETGAFPFADKLLQYLDAEKEVQNQQLSAFMAQAAQAASQAQPQAGELPEDGAGEQP